jgi:hypothetical protein
MSAAPSGGKLYGLLAEFAGPEHLLKACEKVRDAGYTKWDAHAPFPVHGLNDAMGIRATKLGWLVLGAGATGLLIALVLQWWTAASDYPIIVSGKPFWSIPANIPVTFELTILLAATTAFVGMLAFNALPRFHHPLFKSRSFRGATSDRFFISIEAEDPKFDSRATEAFLQSLGGANVERVEG